jgi:RNA polymerase sigma factor (sigma-70 family)
VELNETLGLLESDRGYLTRRLSTVLKNKCDADDALQDAYVRVLEVDQSVNQICNVPAFLARTSKNIAIDRVRRRQRGERIFVSSDASDDVRSQWLECSSPDKGPEETLLYKQLLNFVLDALSELPEKCSRAYVLSCVEERNYKEIASEVGVSVSMIEKYVARARRHLQTNVVPALNLLT